MTEENSTETSSPTRDRTPPNLATAQSTAEQNTSARRLSAVYRMKRGLASEVQLEEIDGENAEWYFNSFFGWAATTPIPNRFDENLLPKTSNGRRMVDTKCLQQYIGKHLKEIRIKFPNHPDWINLSNIDRDFPVWYTDQRRDFETAHGRFKNTFSNSDMVFGIEPLRPLYRDNGAPNLQDGDDITDFLSVCDLKHIMLTLIKKADGRNQCLEQRCMLGIMNDAIGRGGEIRLQCYNEWMYHPALNITDISWKEIKKIDKYAMPMIPNKLSWLFDFYHCLGCFFCCENGLFRTKEQIRKGHLNLVFPYLHKFGMASVTTHLTKIIRNNFPDGIPQAIAKQFSAKSNREAAITELAISGKVLLFDACQRTGHSTGTSIDSYYDKSNVVSGLRAAKVRAGYYNPDSPVILPRLEEALGINCGPMITKFIQSLFVVSVPSFLPKGDLYEVLRICTASLILHHDTVSKECGLYNYITATLNKAARTVNLSDPRVSNRPPEFVLRYWSDLIKTDYESRCVELMKSKPDMISMSTTLNQVVSMVAGLQSNISTLVVASRDQETTVASQESEIVQLKLNQQSHINKIEELEKTNRKLRHVVSATVQSPPSARGPASPSCMSNVTQVSRNGTESTLTVDTSIANITTTSPIHQSNTLKAMMTWNAEGEKRAAMKQPSSCSNKKKKKQKKSNTFDSSNQLENILSTFAIDGRLNKNNLLETTIRPGEFTEKSRMKACFELAQIVMTTEEKEDLFSKDKVRVYNAAGTITSSCMKKLHEDYEEKGQYDSTDASSRTTTSYSAIGMRLIQYKNLLIQIRNIKDSKITAKDQPLMERDTAAAMRQQTIDELLPRPNTIDTEKNRNSDSNNENSNKE